MQAAGANGPVFANDSLGKPHGQRGSLSILGVGCVCDQVR